MKTTTVRLQAGKNGGEHAYEVFTDLVAVHAPHLPEEPWWPGTVGGAEYQQAGWRLRAKEDSPVLAWLIW